METITEAAVVSDDSQNLRTRNRFGSRCNPFKSAERTNRQHANHELQMMGTFHDSIPIYEIDCILTANGFRATEAAIWCGRDGHSNDQVGDRTWLSVSWHKMEVTGRYEIVAYVS
jgi:hypothetical protein